jgi:hypothetical protein
MHPADKATLRLTLGLGFAALIAYGMALTAPYVVCVMAAMLLSKPGPPLPLAKGIIAALLIGVLVAAGVLMVPLLEHYAVAGILLTAVILFVVFFAGLKSGSPLTMVLVIAFALMPVAGVIEQALIAKLALTLAVGVAVGTLVGFISSVFFPDRAAPAPPPAKPTRPESAAAAWIALRATLIVMPVFVLALTNPSFYLAAIMKTVALGQQAGETDARSAGRELVGSTLSGAVIAFGIWLGLSLRANLWMLVLWLMAAALFVGSAMTGARFSRFRPSYWSNALITALILIGPAIEDSASGKGVIEGTVMRTCLFVGVALYAWGTILLLERWRAARLPATGPKPTPEERLA